MPGNMYDAYTVFKKLRGLPDNQTSWLLYKRFLGVPEHAPLYGIHQDAREKINWLLGPHAKTMYKIWEAQHEKGPTS